MIHPTGLVIVLLIVFMVFGTTRLRGLGADLGSAISRFRQSMSDGKGAASTETVKHEPK